MERKKRLNQTINFIETCLSPRKEDIVVQLIINGKGQFNQTYVMRCEIWYHLYNLKILKNNHGEVLLLVKL